MLERPVTSVTCALLGGIFAYITAHGIGYEQVGLSYEKALGRWELWRIVTGEKNAEQGPSWLLLVLLTWAVL